MGLFLYTTYVFMICTGKLHLLLQVLRTSSTTEVFKFLLLILILPENLQTNPYDSYQIKIYMNGDA